jgi:hypothetical protein
MIGLVMLALIADVVAAPCEAQLDRLRKFKKGN